MKVVKKCVLCKRSETKKNLISKDICLECALERVRLNAKHQSEKKGYFYYKKTKAERKAISEMKNKKGKSWNHWLTSMQIYLDLERANHLKQLKKRRAEYHKKKLRSKTKSRRNKKQ